MASYNHREYLNDDAFPDGDELWTLSPPSSPAPAATRLSPESDADAPLRVKPELDTDQYDRASPEIIDHTDVQDPFSMDPVDSYLLTKSLSRSSRYHSDDLPMYDMPWLPSDAPRYPPPSPSYISPVLLQSPDFSEDEVSPPSSPPSSPEMRSRSLRPRRIAASRRELTDDSDQESGDSGSEYNPSDPEDSDAPHSRHGQKLNARRQAATRKRCSRSRPSSLRSSCSPDNSSSKRHHPYAFKFAPRHNPGSLARTRQVTTTEIPQTVGYECPYCEHVQINRRRPDLRRHISTHTQDERKRRTGPSWLCCGVPVDVADQYGIEDCSSATTYARTGKARMIGGCGAMFSRKDAYHRHLRVTQKGCVGDPNGEWLPGNKSRR